MSAGVMLGHPRPAAAEPPPEVRHIRLARVPAICLAPQFLAEELLRSEGFERVEYVEVTTTAWDAAAKVDITMDALPTLVYLLGGGRVSGAVLAPFVVVAGVHAGCYELFGNDRVQAIRDLKSKRVAISSFGSAPHVFVASMVAYVGMDPRHDINWTVGESFG